MSNWTLEAAAEAREAYIAFSCGDLWKIKPGRYAFAREIFARKDFADLLKIERFYASKNARVLMGKEVLWRSTIVTAQLDYLARTQ